MPFFLSPTPLGLIADHQALAGSIRAELGTLAPACIVIDTVNRSLTGSESDDRDTRRPTISVTPSAVSSFSSIISASMPAGLEATPRSAAPRTR